MSIVSAKRKWYRLHASTWVVALVAVAVLVLLVVPAVYSDLGSVHGYQHGWPWPYLERFGEQAFRDSERIPWLLEQAWQFDGDVAWGFLAADTACALAITGGVAAAWEWRRRRRERLWHLTLGELLLATLAVACGLGWWQTNVREAAREESIVEALIQWKIIEYGFPIDSVFLGPVWLHRLTGQQPDWLHRVTRFDFPGGAPQRQPSSEVVRSIGSLSHIATLYLGKVKVGAGELAPLRNLSRLSRLEVSAGKIDEKNGEVLAGLPALRSLSLTDCSVSGAALAQLTRHGRIEELDLESSAMTEDGLKHIARMHSLERLTLRDAGVTDAGVAQLSRMTGLKGLSLTDNKITDEGLRHLRNLKNLEVLALGGTEVTESACQELSRHLPRCDIVTPLEWQANSSRSNP